MVDDDDDWDDWEPPPDPSARTWRHPSEIAAEAAATEAAEADARWRRFASRGTFVAGVLAGAGVCLIGVASVRFASSTDTAFTFQTAATNPIEPVGNVAPIDLIVDEAATTTTTPSSAATLTLLTQAAQASSQLGDGVPHEPLPDGLVLIRSGESVVHVASGVAVDGLVLTSASAIGDAQAVGLEQNSLHSTGDVLATDPFSDVAIISYDRSVAFIELDPSVTVLPAVGSSVAIAGSTASGESTGVEGSIISTGQMVRSTTGHAVVGSLETSAELWPLLPGALLTDTDGTPVGMVFSSESYLAAAIPLADARAVARMMIHHGWASDTWLGVRGVVVDAGIEITDITAESPAQLVGLQTGDVLTAFGDHPLDSIGALVAKLRVHQPGDRVQLHLVRQGESLTIDLTLGTRSLGPEAD